LVVVMTVMGFSGMLIGCDRVGLSIGQEQVLGSSRLPHQWRGFSLARAGATELGRPPEAGGRESADAGLFR